MSEVDPGTDELDEYRIAQRRRRRWTLVVGSIAIALIGAGVIWRRMTGLPSLDRETEQDIREALPEIEKLPVEIRRSFAARALAELEPERLPAPMIAALNDYGGAPPHYAGMVLLEPFAHDADTRATWELACPAGLGAIADGAAEGPRATYLRCELDRLELIEAGEISAASLGELVVAHAAWAWLVEHHADSELERRLLRMLVLGK
ncbi:hypothetical protein ACNOYE_28425 [Nannocystaceae bacterium ST9]